MKFPESYKLRGISKNTHNNKFQHISGHFLDFVSKSLHCEYKITDFQNFVESVSFQKNINCMKFPESYKSRGFQKNAQNIRFQPVFKFMHWSTRSQGLFHHLSN